METGDWINAGLMLCALGVAIWASWYQARQTNRHLGISIIRDCIREFFYSDEIRRQRLKTAQFILRTRCKGHDAARGEIPSEVFELMDFFGEVGIYVEDGVISERYAFHMFHHWFIRYFVCLEKYLLHEEKKDGIE